MAMHNDFTSDASASVLDSTIMQSVAGEEAQDDARNERSALLPATLDSIRGTNTTERPGWLDESGRGSIRGANRPRISFDVAAARILEHGRGLGSIQFPMSRMRVESGRMIAGERELRIESEGWRRLCNQFGAPADYVRERLSPELRDSVMAFHLRSGSAARSGLTDANSRILHRNGEFVALGRSDLHTLGGDAFLQAVTDGFEEDARTMEVQELEVEDESIRLDIVVPSVANEVRRGDVIQAGVRLEHAYTGERATSVLAYFVRLLCTNGTVYRQCVGSRQTARTRRLDAARHDAEGLQVDQIRRLILTTRQGLAEKLEGIRRLTEERADEQQLEQFLRRARMHSGGLVNQLRQSWAAEGSEQTAFGLFNALTRLATHGTELSGRQRAALARLAGIYANRHVHLCPNCFSILA
jgi:hypothetical protein